MNNKVLAQDFNCKAHFRRGLKKGFTLAEVLITLAIIGVVAAMTIPAVIVNTNQMEFKTGLRKAISVLNSAITLNKALTGEGPYDNSEIISYLSQNMTTMMRYRVNYPYGQNIGFYTTDGMRYEIPSDADKQQLYSFPLYENRSAQAKFTEKDTTAREFGNCGSMGLAHNPDSTTEPPCIVMVDVNGDRKPNPTSPIKITGSSYGMDGSTMRGVSWGETTGINRYADPNGRLLNDLFSIMITDQGAIPYGVVAQKAMYQAQK